jgi:hypothetical protein
MRIRDPVGRLCLKPPKHEGFIYINPHLIRTGGALLRYEGEVLEFDGQTWHDLYILLQGKGRSGRLAYCFIDRTRNKVFDGRTSCGYLMPINILAFRTGREGLTTPRYAFI